MRANGCAECLGQGLIDRVPGVEVVDQLAEVLATHPALEHVLGSLTLTESPLVAQEPVEQSTFFGQASARLEVERGRGRERDEVEALVEVRLGDWQQSDPRGDWDVFVAGQR